MLVKTRRSEARQFKLPVAKILQDGPVFDVFETQINLN